MIFWVWLASLASIPACHLVDGDRITMRDIAAADARFSSSDPAETIALSPAPGVQRVFFPGELIRLAEKDRLLITESLDRLCFERRTREVTSEDVVTSVRRWAPAGAKIEVLEQSKFPAPLGSVIFQRPGVTQPGQDGSILVRGYVEFGKAQRFPLWARVRLSARVPRVVAVVDIPVATQIGAEQVRVQDADVVIDSRPMAATADQVLSRIARQRIVAGSFIPLSVLEAPKQVVEGAVVTVEVRNGGAHLELVGRAEASGRTGDMISIRNPSSGKAFQARVIAENRVLVVPPGALMTREADSK